MSSLRYGTLWNYNMEYPADDVRVSISRPTELVISLLHHFEHLALRSPVMIEQIVSSLFI